MSNETPAVEHVEIESEVGPAAMVRAEQPLSVTKAMARQPLAAVEMSVDEVVAQVEKIRDVMGRVMNEGEHYGTIPGCGDKATLFQPGAEILMITFGLRPEFKVDERNLPGGHKEFFVKCTMRTLGGGFAGEGVAMCSTMESNYRYRKQERVCPQCDAEAIIKGKEEYGGGWLCWAKKDGCGAKFSDGDNQIESQHAGKVENEDPADFYNTCAKMGAKRAKVAAALNATGASNFFTQDLEDMKANAAVSEQPTAPTPAPAGETRATPAAAPASTPPSSTPPPAQPPTSGSKPVCPDCLSNEHVYPDKKNPGKFFCWKEKGGCGKNFRVEEKNDDLKKTQAAIAESKVTVEEQDPQFLRILDEINPDRDAMHKFMMDKGHLAIDETLEEDLPIEVKEYIVNKTDGLKQSYNTWLGDIPF